MKYLGLILLILLLLRAMQIYMLYRQRPAYSRYWQVRAEAPVPANAIWYVALGDSAAQGIGASQPAKSYVGLIASALESKTGRSVHVVNLGVSGARIQDVIDKQIPQLKQLPMPEDAVITLDIGSNNMKGYNREEFNAQFERMLQLLPPQTIVADIPFFGPDYHRHGGKQAREANEFIRPLIARYGFRVAPIFDHTKNNSSLSYYAADFFHPSDKGYKSWFDAFWLILDN